MADTFMEYQPSLLKSKLQAAETAEYVNITRYIRRCLLISSDMKKARVYYHYSSDEPGSITYIIKVALRKKLE